MYKSFVFLGYAQSRHLFHPVPHSSLPLHSSPILELFLHDSCWINSTAHLHLAEPPADIPAGQPGVSVFPVPRLLRPLRLYLQCRLGGQQQGRLLGLLTSPPAWPVALPVARPVAVGRMRDINPTKLSELLLSSLFLSSFSSVTPAIAAIAAERAPFDGPTAAPANCLPSFLPSFVASPAGRLGGKKGG